ncbi:MAG: hypothetical protein LBM09_01045 [Candidatus Nomurabacteria bacterium]|jgi:hypothetical protein|nr:hypothetical protein [Candidatus Nomurabacteria bacterium]
MNTKTKPKTNWLFVVLRTLAASPAILASIYFMERMITAVDMVAGENQSFESFGVLIVGIFTTVLINNFVSFLNKLFMTLANQSVAEDKIRSKVAKIAFIIRLVFVATFATFWSLGIIMYIFLSGEAEFDIFTVMLFFMGLGFCAACYGYLLYGIMRLQGKSRIDGTEDMRLVEKISTVIFAIAWAIFGILAMIAGGSEIANLQNNQEAFATFVIVLGPLVYIAQKYILRHILKSINNKRRDIKTAEIIKTKYAQK